MKRIAFAISKQSLSYSHIHSNVAVLSFLHGSNSCCLHSCEKGGVGGGGGNRERERLCKLDKIEKAVDACGL